MPGINGILNSTTGGDDTTHDGQYAGTNYPYVMFEDARDQDGVDGQGNDDPPGYFSNHWVTTYSGEIYDPSYGSGPHGSEPAHENAAIDGIHRSDGRAKKNDTLVQELDYD